ncbi:MAG: ATP-binding protein [Dehalobacterium sp.]|jgi:nitrogen-specific signal transduction histidine kinase
MNKSVASDLYSDNYKLLCESIDKGICIIEKLDMGQDEPNSFKYVLTNPAFEKITGLSQVTGKTMDQVLPDIDESQIKVLNSVITKGQALRFETYEKSLDKWFSVYALPLGDAKLNKIALIFNEIRAIKKLEQRFEKTTESSPNILEASHAMERHKEPWGNLGFFQEQQRLFDLLEALPFYICVLDSDYRIVFSNRAFREKYGENDGHRCYENIWYLDKPCKSCRTFEVFKTKRPNRWFYSTQNGSAIDVYAYPYIDRAGTPLVVEISMDITEQIKMEEGMAHLERLNLVGEMAAGIGHEIRNPMTCVRGFLQLLGDKREYQNDRHFFDLMIEELDRANQIITEYLSMAKDKKISLELECLDDLIEMIYPMVLADANLHEINVCLDLNRPPKVNIDRREIKQLILNMVSNSKEAMDKNGTITIGTLQEGNEVVLYVQDEGIGLPIDVLDKLGQPFITTKEDGTGLGLAICYSIAAHHNARIDYRTGLCGTTFYVRFPLEET